MLNGFLNLFELTRRRNVGLRTISDIFSCQTSSNNQFNFVKTLIKLENKELLNQILIDYISYNLIPTFFNYFVERNSFNSFCTFIQQLQDNFEQQRIKINLHILLSRPLFQSPLLTEFLHHTICPFFRPLFQQGLNINDDKLIKDIQRNILSCIQQNIKSFPHNIKFFLEKFENKIDFLKECLFKPMSKRPELFLVSDYWNAGVPEEEIYLKEMLQKVFDDELIEKVLSSIFENKYFDKCFINESEKVPIIQFKPMIKLDLFDLECINLIQTCIEKIDNNELNDDDSLLSILSIYDNFHLRRYVLYCVDFQLFENDYYKHQEISIKDMNDCWFHFNKMIKEAPPLPLNVNLPKEKVTIESFLDLVERYLVETCDQNTIESQRLSFNFFKENLLNNPKEQQYIQTKESLLFKTQFLRKYAKDETIQSQLITQFYFDSIELELKQTHSVRLIDLLSSSLASNIIQSIPKKKPTKIDYQLDPNIIYENNVNSFLPNNYIDYNIDVKSFPIISVIMHRMFEGMSFSDFKSQRPELAKYDQMYDEAKSHFSIDFFVEDDFFKSYMHTLFNRDNNDLFYLYKQEISKVFENDDDFISKFDDLSRIVNLFLSLVYDIYGIDGADYTVLLIEGLMSISNTPKFISNHAFMSYAHNVPTYQEFFMVDTYMAVSLLGDNCDLSTVLNKSLKNKKITEIYIVGNDPEKMISLLLMIKDLVKSKNTFCEKELTIIKDQINSNPDPLISLDLNSENLYLMNALSFVVLCKFIRPSKRQDFDGKYAIYAFSSNTDNKECLEAFIKNKHITNKKKMIVYETSIGNINTKNINCIKYDEFSNYFKELIKSLNLRDNF
ncbi:hypothetical protein M9Y10_037514 [Tritrichomonas musculus]|uniref:RGS domain-containing protein n=1 Tax=Tritrichomonas musculus TaxID=1915356 RepID=A0ABR2GRK6_9EUKA